MKIPPFFAGPVESPSNWVTLSGAEALAKRIMDVWRQAGHHSVIAWVDPNPFYKPKKRDGGGGYFRVRTNLVNGLPPSYERIQSPKRQAKPTVA